MSLSCDTTSMRGSRDLFCWQYDIPLTPFMPVWIASSYPVQTGSRLPSVGNIHQSGNPHQWALPGLVCKPLGLTPKFYFTSSSCVPQGSWRRRRETICNASFLWRVRSLPLPLLFSAWARCPTSRRVHRFSSPPCGLHYCWIVLLLSHLAHVVHICLATLVLRRQL